MNKIYFLCIGLALVLVWGISLDISGIKSELVILNHTLKQSPVLVVTPNQKTNALELTHQ